ncbi:unnamed protein product [Pleuronectes platessa]|uniref:Uncharacterized protein n=1 Tax=Pleuronectes platessa TaxID=8262 RepID=A0A9N7UBC8_PLEPL|nr:unnamed protein product [Pleuronectes platessa]
MSTCTTTSSPAPRRRDHAWVSVVESSPFKGPVGSSLIVCPGSRTPPQPFSVSPSETSSSGLSPRSVHRFAEDTDPCASLCAGLDPPPFSPASRAAPRPPLHHWKQTN